MTNELRFSLELLSELKKIRDQFSAKTVSKNQKDDGTPVTELDQKLNDHIVAALSKHFAHDSIVTEELKDAIIRNTEKPTTRTWLIDPLDGTKEFIKNLPEWSVHLGLVENNEVIFGVVGALDMDKVYYAHKGQGAFVTNLAHQTKRQLHCATTGLLSDLKLVISRSRTDDRLTQFVQKNKIKTQIPLGSMGLKMCAIAEGSADIYLNFDGRCSLWDTCAPEVILKEAGGHVSYLDNTDIDYQDKQHFMLKKGFVACTASSWASLKSANAL